MIKGRPSDIYYHRLREGTLSPDSAQQAMLAHFDAQYAAVYRLIRQSQGGWGQRLATRLLDWLAAPSPPEDSRQGLYLWGHVGRGKSLLMNILRHSLPEESCRYLHFHQLMSRVHDDLKELEQETNPMEIVVERILGGGHILFIDEFVVVDIADAMIMRALLEAVFARQALLVLTSNFAPGDLYADGLQRDRFLPAIALIEQKMNVLEFSAGSDYRRQKFSRLPIFVHDSGSNARARLAEVFIALTDAQPQPSRVPLGGREVEALGAAEGVVWLYFNVLCGQGRSRRDYHHLAMIYYMVIIDGLFAMDDEDNELARRFIHLIDILYENKVKIVVSSAAPIDGLYSGERLRDEFARTASRLAEMCTNDWLSLPHLRAISESDFDDADAGLEGEGGPAAEGGANQGSQERVS